MRGMVMKGKCIGAWDVGADECTSDEDEDKVVRPKRGEGRVGRGSPMLVTHNGGQRPFVDGCGLCRLHRWPPARRHIDPIARRIRNELQANLEKTMGDLTRVAYAMACQRYKASPFSEELLRSGRQILRAISGHTGADWMDEPVVGQPFLLHLLSEIARILGDPDWRVLVQASLNYADGVPVGFKKRLPRTPAVFERKTRWRAYDEDDFCLELKGNYRSAHGVVPQRREQFTKEVAEKMIVRIPRKEAEEKWGRTPHRPSRGDYKTGPDRPPLHDGTHGVAVNPNLRIRDQARCPASTAVKHAIGEVQQHPGGS